MPARSRFPLRAGQILDRSGTVLVDSTPVPAVLISPPDLPVPMTAALLTSPPPADQRVYDRLASVLGISKAPITCKVPGRGTASLTRIACAVAQKWAVLPYANVSIKTDVPTDVQYYLQERQNEFAGVEVATVWLRRYPMTKLAAQLFGTVGPISPAEVKLKRYKGVSQSAVVGQSGLEWYYDKYLRGVDGADKVQVDALGRFRGDLSQRQPQAGYNLKLSLDTKLQQVGQASLQQSITNNYPSNGGAFVAMNPVTGEVYAMGSLPSFDPNVFTKPVSESVYKSLNNASSNYPLINRAIQSAGPTGSTFKPITATAALQSGAWSTGEAYDDTGQFCEGGGLCRHNAGGAAYGVLDLVRRAAGLLRRLLLQPGRAAQQRLGPGAARCRSGPAPTGSGARPASTSVARPRATCPRRPGARTHQRGSRWPASTSAMSPGAAGSPTAARGRRATTSTWPSARATCRPRRCSSPSPTRPSPTAARSCARTSAWRSTPPTARC